MYRESIETGNTVKFVKCTGNLKMCYSQVVLLSEHNKDAKLHSKTAYKLPRGQWIITIDKMLEILHKIVQYI